MTSRTSPCDNSSPVDTPLCPSRALPVPPIDLGAWGIAEMALPPTGVKRDDAPCAPTASDGAFEATVPKNTTIKLHEGEEERRRL